MTALVAGEVRAELARARISLTQLVRLMETGSFSYWQRRVSGVTPLDVEDLARLAGLLECSPADFLPGQKSGRRGPDDGGVWAPSGSNRRPTDYKLGERSDADVIHFPSTRLERSIVPAAA